jgi:hypothetical protein
MSEIEAKVGGVAGAMFIDLDALIVLPQASVKVQVSV